MQKIFSLHSISMMTACMDLGTSMLLDPFMLSSLHTQTDASHTWLAISQAYSRTPHTHAWTPHTHAWSPHTHMVGYLTSLHPDTLHACLAASHTRLDPSHTYGWISHKPTAGHLTHTPGRLTHTPGSLTHIWLDISQAYIQTPYMHAWPPHTHARMPHTHAWMPHTRAWMPDCRYGDSLKSGWKNMMECIVRLYKLNMLPESILLMESEDPESARRRIPRPSNKARNSSAGSMLSRAFSRYHLLCFALV